MGVKVVGISAHALDGPRCLLLNLINTRITGKHAPVPLPRTAVVVIQIHRVALCGRLAWVSRIYGAKGRAENCNVEIPPDSGPPKRSSSRNSSPATGSNTRRPGSVPRHSAA